MRKSILSLFIALAAALSASAQTAKEVLDKAAAAISNKDGVTANFTMSDPENGETAGTIAVKGTKFHTTTPEAQVWFNGETQWTLMKSSNEVNVNTPTESELQSLNPYNFVNMYRSGFTYTMGSQGKNHIVTLVSTNKKRKIQQLIITIDKATYIPTQLKMLRKEKWTTINISNLKNANLSDNIFTFNPKDHPDAELIDLR